MPEHPKTRCGTIALAGRPNAGKSTLLNALVGESLAITSRKPQSTRYPVVGLRTDAESQIVFVDPPGLLEPRYRLQEAMLRDALDTLRHADAILHLHPITEPAPAPLATLLPEGTHVTAPTLVVRTKADLGGSPPPGELAASAVTGEGLDALLDWCRAHVPPGPFRYDPDELSTQPLRFFVAEFVREAAFELLGDELPYAVATSVEEFREGSDPLYIRVTIHVERESQRRMVIGKGGATIRSLGSHARRRIEAFVGSRVYLDLWVKTLHNWRTNAAALRRFERPG